MIFRLVRCGALAAAFMFTATSVQARDDITVVDARFTSAVQQREPIDTLQSPHPKPPLVLWTRMNATKEALLRLQKDGKLPIRHRWTRFVGAIGETGTGTVTDDISGAIGSADFLAALERELTARNFFDWRFWSEKRNLGKGQWQVEIVYANGEPVVCQHINQPAEPCRFLIEVR